MHGGRNRSSGGARPGGFRGRAAVAARSMRAVIPRSANASPWPLGAGSDREHPGGPSLWEDFPFPDGFPGHIVGAFPNHWVLT